MMSSSVSTADASPAASGPADAGPSGAGIAEPAPLEGWRSGDLAALRAELDRIDNGLHDLLMQRARVVEYVGRSGKPAAFRPGREASIIRRLLGRHHGALPPAFVVRIWRELLAGTTAMQGGFSLAVCDADQGALLTQLTREHFGALTPLRGYGSAAQALRDVARGTASVAVLPYPSEADGWWVALLHHEPRLHIVGRLPFWKPRPEGAPSAQALVVASTQADASEADQSLLGLECNGDVRREGLSSALSEAGLTQQSMVVMRQPGSAVASVLVEVAGYLCDDDPRLSRLDTLLRRPIVLGCYAVPVGGGAR
jgi:chorismate mutase/prephenate dehydratase